MVLIIGGRSQGKTEYANRTYVNVTDNLQDDIRKWLLNKESADNTQPDVLCDEFMEEELSTLPDDSVIICDEVGYGIVPVERFERLYRDVTGRVCCRLAERAEEVVRVQCGIGVKIK
jgi:adenosyl cobinamide kinase/adenosyl cobinamide phosphate guanylyltransferase